MDAEDQDETDEDVVNATTNQPERVKPRHRLCEDHWLVAMQAVSCKTEEEVKSRARPSYQRAY